MYCAHRQRVLGRAHIGEGVFARIPLRDGIQLPVVPDDGVQLALHHALAPENIAVGRQAHVHDQGLDRRLGRLGFRAAGGLGQKIHGAHDARLIPCAGLLMQHFGEANVTHQGRHAGKAEILDAVAEQDAADMGAMIAGVQPQIRLVLAKVFAGR